MINYFVKVLSTVNHACKQSDTYVLATLELEYLAYPTLITSHRLGCITRNNI